MYELFFNFPCAYFTCVHVLCACKNIFIYVEIHDICVNDVATQPHLHPYNVSIPKGILACIKIVHLESIAKFPHTAVFLSSLAI